MFRYLAVLAVMLACFRGDVSAVTDQDFQDLINVVERLGSEISELKQENKLLSSENRRQDSVIHHLQVVLMLQFGQHNRKAGSQAVDLIQNTTIEERVSLLELQVADLDEDVDYLFDEQIIQDERLLNLETETNALDEEVEDLQDATQALDFRVTVLEETGGSNGNSSINELEERVETLEGTAADHETRITNAEGDVEDLEGSIADHETRLTAAEENIQGLQMTDISHDARISALEENGGGGGGSQNETIAFHAVLTSYSTIPSGDVVEFNEVILNEGNGYDSTTGVFTVPPGGDGLYYFTTYLRIENGEFGLFEITLNDDRICTTWGDHNESGDDGPQSTCSAVVSVAEGDEVKLVLGASTDDTPLVDSTSYHYNGFNGFRII